MIFFLIFSIISKFASSSKKKARSLAVILVDFNYFSKFSLGYSILLVQARIQLKPCSNKGFRTCRIDLQYTRYISVLFLLGL